MPWLALMIATALLPATAWAQFLDIQHGRVAPGTTGLAVTQGARTEIPQHLRIGADLQLMLRPLAVTNSRGEVLGAVVGSQLGLYLHGAYGITRNIDVSASWAVVPYETIQAVWTGSAFLRTSQTVAGVGDVWLESRFQLVHQNDADAPQMVDIALRPMVHVPVCTTHFLSDCTLAFAPEVAVARQQGPVLFAANVGFVFRKSQVVDGLALGQQLSWRGGLGFDLERLGLPARSQLSAEVFGLAALASNSVPGGYPAEWLASGRFAFGDWLSMVGVGTGISGGYGAPELRLLASLTWAPLPVPPPPDSDKDGILDPQDACPDQPETVNGFEDTDGCPDVLDRDKDGIPDDKDKCPTEPEDKDGFQDDDGCPEPDNDNDTIPDHLDKCPNEAEDFDGVADEDGCPELDADGDGIADDKDQCPLQAEVINGVKDDDGCPDEGEQLVQVTETTVELKGMVFFGIGSDELFKRAYAVLDQLAAVLRNHQDMRILVEGYADAEGGAAHNLRLSKKRAEAVRKYLITKGIDGDRIKTAGYGETHFRAPNAGPRGRSLNRRVTVTVISNTPKNASPEAGGAPPPRAAPPPPNDGIPAPIPESELDSAPPTAPQSQPPPTLTPSGGP